MTRWMQMRGKGSNAVYDDEVDVDEEQCKGNNDVG